MPTRPTKSQVEAAKNIATKATGKQVFDAALNMQDSADSQMLQRDLVRAGLAEERDGVFTSTNDIHQLGDYILSYDPNHNPFLNALINRIAFVTMKQMVFDNPLSVFNKGYIEFGETVEEIFVEIAKPFRFSPANAEKTVFKREIPGVRAAFHRMNFQIYYKQTISNDQLRTAFLSWQGVSDLASRIIRAMVTALQVDTALMTKYVIARSILNGYLGVHEIQAITADTAADFLVDLRALAGNLMWPSNENNMAAVTTTTPLERQRLILTNEARARVDVNALAAAFNLSKAEYMQQEVTVDSFARFDWDRLELLFTDPETGELDPDYEKFSSTQLALLENVPGVLVDIDFIQNYDNFNNMTQQYNGEGLYWNYWLHGWKTFSVSPFSQAIVFSPDNQTVTGVAVTPGTVTVTKGQSAIFEAKVTGTGIVNTNVIWSVTGDSALASGTHMDGSKLYVATDETNTTLTVKAVSVEDSTKTGTATVTVQA